MPPLPPSGLQQLLRSSKQISYLPPIHSDTQGSVSLCNPQKDGTIFLPITIDDFSVAASSTAIIDTLYDTLQMRYNIRRLSEPKLFLNWRIQLYQNSYIHISQPHTMQSIVSNHILTKCNRKPTPYADTKNSDTPTASKLLTVEKAFSF